MRSKEAEWLQSQFFLPSPGIICVYCNFISNHLLNSLVSPLPSPPFSPPPTFFFLLPSLPPHPSWQRMVPGLPLCSPLSYSALLKHNNYVCGLILPQRLILRTICLNLWYSSQSVAIISGTNNYKRVVLVKSMHSWYYTVVAGDLPYWISRSSPINAFTRDSPLYSFLRNTHTHNWETRVDKSVKLHTSFYWNAPQAIVWEFNTLVLIYSW